MVADKRILEPYEPLAYCSGKNVETLTEHISTMLSIYDIYFSRWNWEQISSSRINISANIIDKAVKCTVILHDIGKLFYQDRIKTGRSTTLHEYYSLLITEKIGDQLVKHLEDTRKVLDSLEWALLIHHMSLRDPLKISGNITNIAEYWKVPLTVKITTEISEWISRIFKHYLGFEVKLQVGSVLSLREINKIIRRLLANFWDLYPLTLRLIRILIITDNYAAALNRGGTPAKKVFLRDLPNAKDLVEAKRRLREWLQD
ncbi:hypothetical protein DRJ17_03165 [Candidatus Woesearchaeota archaeon]|nr:MAG: hypothetical protein DRJ17_03165 [Candidatus Woesearchaeota archaeon]